MAPRPVLAAASFAILEAKIQEFRRGLSSKNLCFFYQNPTYDHHTLSPHTLSQYKIYLIPEYVRAIC